MSKPLKAVLSYIFICISITYVLMILADRPLVSWVHAEGVNEIALFHWILWLPKVLAGLSCAVFFVVLWRALGGYDNTALRPYIAMANSFAIAVFVKTQMKMVFGKTWPNTWRCDNPSWLRDQVYEFNWFEGGHVMYQSFPSGTMAVTAAALTMWALQMPKLRMIAYISQLLVGVSLILTHFHFVSDVFAGWCLGNVVAIGVYTLFRSNRA